MAHEVRIADLDLEEFLAERRIEVAQARRGVRCVQRCTREPNDTAREVRFDGTPRSREPW
jgi:hypothetical protein